MIVHKPPAPYQLAADAVSVFLAGSIDMGAAHHWQAEATARLADLDVVVLNPRRDDWDATWRQSIDDPAFRTQVEWELDGLDRASVIALWLAPESHAPISLLELGLTARSGRVIAGCPAGFWRKGNVEVVCERHGIPLLEDFDPFITTVRERLASRRVT